MCFAFVEMMSWKSLTEVVQKCVFVRLLPSVLQRCWLTGRKGVQPVKTEW